MARINAGMLSPAVVHFWDWRQGKGIGQCV